MWILDNFRWLSCIGYHLHLANNETPHFIRGILWKYEGGRGAVDYPTLSKKSLSPIFIKLVCRSKEFLYLPSVYIYLISFREWYNFNQQHRFPDSGYYLWQSGSGGKLRKLWLASFEVCMLKTCPLWNSHISPFKVLALKFPLLTVLAIKFLSQWFLHLPGCHP